MHILYIGGDIVAEQTRITVSFRENEEEKALYKWVMEKAKVIGPANAIKQILYEKMIEEKRK
jgi:hypothetical protein